MRFCYGAPPKFERAECIKTAYKTSSYNPIYTVVHISLDENPSYEALSYTWGDTSVQGPRILLDSKPFQVTVNLGAALLNLRDEASGDPKERILWIDAICINQTDIQERNEQVQRMKAIYSSAVQVVIWLGRYHETQDDMLEFDEDVWELRSIKEGTKETTATVFEFMKSLSRRITKPEPGSDLNRPFGDMLPRGTRDLANLKRLLMRPWFERLVVVQELLVAQQAQVICGRCSLSWSELEKACGLLLQLIQQQATDLRIWGNFYCKVKN